MTRAPPVRASSGSSPATSAKGPTTIVAKRRLDAVGTRRPLGKIAPALSITTSSRAPSRQDRSAAARDGARAIAMSATTVRKRSSPWRADELVADGRPAVPGCVRRG